MFTFSSETRLHSLVAKANKVSAKLDIAPITVISITPRKETRQTEAGTNYSVVVYDAELDIPETLVKIAGQEVVARIEQIEDLNLITRISDADVNLDAYRNAKITCQHCNLKRSRKASWVVNDAAQGLIQVGDSCATLYFGVDVDRLLRTVATVFGILDDEDEWGEGRNRSTLDFSTLASVVAWKCATSGFVTKKRAGDFGVSTSAHAAFLSEGCPKGQFSKEAQEWVNERTALDAWREDHFKGQDLFDEALDWWLSRDDLSKFEHNCKVAILSRNVKFLGLIAYGLKIWTDTILTPTVPKVAAISQWVGEIGKRIVFKSLTVSRLASFDTAYGTTTIVTFTDVDGNPLVWKASCDPGITLGQTYEVKGTVKAHNDYKGTKQTELSRCALSQ